MPIEFIDNNAAIGRVARKRIRSHVAMGRNAGKTLVRPSRKSTGPAIPNTTGVVRFPKILEDRHDSTSRNLSIRDRCYEIERPVGDVLSIFSIPKPLNSESAGLVEKVFSFIGGSRYNPELSITLDAAGSHTSMWVQFMFLDEAYFHCVMAMSITILNTFLIRPEDPTEATRHLLQTLRMVNERLSENQAVSDTTLAVVVVMAQHARLQGQYHQGLVHLEGLQRMIELRGGVSQLTKNAPGLTQMIFKTDFEYALHQGSETRFSKDDIVANSTTTLGLPIGVRREDGNSNLPVPNILLLRHMSTDLGAILTDATDLAWLVNDASARDRPKLKNFPLHDNLLLLGYRLVSTRPLSRPRPLSQVENAVHLGLTAFVLSFLRGYDRQIPNIPMLSQLARSAAQEEFDGNQESQEALLWTLFIGAAGSTFGGLDDAWLIPKTAQAMQSLGLHAWEDVVRTLVKFPWVNAVHDQAGQALWRRSIFHSTDFRITGQSKTMG